jgi:hypothetical protein
MINCYTCTGENNFRWGTPTGNYFNKGAGHGFYNTTNKWKINVLVFKFFKFTFLGGDNKSTN